MDYFSRDGTFYPLTYVPIHPSVSVLSATDLKTKKFGFRFTANFAEMGVYEDVSVEKGSTQLKGVIPTLRYIRIKPEAIGRFGPCPRDSSVLGSPMLQCGTDNLFYYSDRGAVTLQFSIMPYPSPAGVQHQPWTFSEYNSSTSTWGHLMHAIGSQKTLWAYTEHHTKFPEDMPSKEALVEKQVLWLQSEGLSSFTYGQAVGGNLEGSAYCVTNFNQVNGYYLGEYKNGLKDGKGRDLQMNAQSGDAVFYKGTWLQDKRHGDFVVEHTSKQNHMNQTARGAYQQDIKVGLWVTECQNGIHVLQQDNFKVVFRDARELLGCFVLGDNNLQTSRKPAEFLTLLIQHQCHDLVTKLAEKLSFQSLYDLCVSSVQQGELRSPVVSFSNSLKPFEPSLLNNLRLIDIKRVLAVFRQALQILDCAQNSPLYAAVKGGIDLYDPRISQKMITDILSKVFPDVRYTEARQKDAASAIATYQQSVQNQYFAGVLQRIAVICDLLAQTSRPEIQPLVQLLIDLKLEDDRLTQQHALEAKRVESLRAERLKVAEWEKVCWALDGEVLAFMRDLRAEEKPARATIIDECQRGVAMLRTRVSAASSIRAPTKPSAPVKVAVSTMSTTSVVPAKKTADSVPKGVDKKRAAVSVSVVATQAAKPYNKPKQHVSANDVMTTLSIPYVAVAKKALQPPAPPLEQIQQPLPVVRDVRRELLFTSVVAAQALEAVKHHPSPLVAVRNNDLSISNPTSQLAKNEPIASGLASARAGFFSQPAMSASSALARPSVNHCILKLPYFISRQLPGSSQGVIDDYLLIYKGMIIQALKMQNQPVGMDEEQCLCDAQRKEKEYFWGFANAFKRGELYTSMVRDATTHAAAFTYLSKGNTINLDLMLTVFQAALRPANLMNKLMQLKEPLMPGVVMFPHENILHKTVFGLLILITDEMGLGALVDRQLFTGDYKAYLAVTRDRIVSADPSNSNQLLSDILNTAMACLQHIIKRPTIEQEDVLCLMK